MTRSKRLFDLMLALVLLPLLAVPLLAVAGCLLVTEGRPIFYAAERMKSPTQGFRLWKFRTMTPVRQDAGVSGGDKTARITRTGRILRRIRGDELPQIWNILKGDMSFVGPRPPLREYVDRFPDLYAEVLRTPPGVTGLATLLFHRKEQRLLSGCVTAQETDRVYCEICVPAKARLDLFYQQRASVCFDLRLIWRTAVSIW